MFEEAGRETFRQMSFVERLNIESVTAQDFLPSEKDSQTVKLIQSCVDQGVPVEWNVFERNEVVQIGCLPQMCVLRLMILSVFVFVAL